MVFCEPVLASSRALVSFATEKDFIGAEGVLTVQAKEIQKKILGNLKLILDTFIINTMSCFTANVRYHRNML
jgi:hypothetical protein